MHMSTRHQKTPKRLSNKEMAEVRRMFDKNINPYQIAKKLGRAPGAINYHVVKMRRDKKNPELKGDGGLVKPEIRKIYMITENRMLKDEVTYLSSKVERLEKFINDYLPLGPNDK